jgi:hypothetical protein
VVFKFCLGYSDGLVSGHISLRTYLVRDLLVLEIYCLRDELA